MGDWIIAKEEKPKPNSTYWCAIRYKYTRFDYETMGSIESKECIVERFLDTDDKSDWLAPMPSQEDVMCESDGHNRYVLDTFFSYEYLEQISEKMDYSDNLFHCQSVEFCSIKTKFINDFEIEIMAYHEMPQDYVEWIKERD